MVYVVPEPSDIVPWVGVFHPPPPRYREESKNPLPLEGIVGNLVRRPAILSSDRGFLLSSLPGWGWAGGFSLISSESRWILEHRESVAAVLTLIDIPEYPGRSFQDDDARDQRHGRRNILIGKPGALGAILGHFRNSDNHTYPVNNAVPWRTQTGNGGW